MLTRVTGLVRSALVVALTAGVLIVGAGDDVAAKSRTVRDPKGDVTKSFNYEVTTGTWRADVSRVTLRHNRESVVVRVDFHTLRKWKDQFGVPNEMPFTDLLVVMNTPTSLFNMRLIRDRGRNESAVYEFVGGYPGNSQWERVCRLKSQINWRNDFIRLEAPRRCFNRPQRISAGVGLYGDWADEGFYVTINDEVKWTRYAARG